MRHMIDNAASASNGIEKTVDYARSLEVTSETRLME